MQTGSLIHGAKFLASFTKNTVTKGNVQITTASIFFQKVLAHLYFAVFIANWTAQAVGIERYCY